MSRTRHLIGIVVVLALVIGACGDGSRPEADPRLGVASSDETTPDDSTTTEGTVPTPSGPCRVPTAVPEGSDADLVTLHGRISALVADAVTLSDAIANAEFGPGWAAQAPVGGAVYAMQSSLYGLVSALERMFRAAGASPAGDGWTFGDDVSLKPFAEPWTAVLRFQAATFPELVTAPDRAAAVALLDGGALCGLVDAFSDALDQVLVGS